MSEPVRFMAPEEQARANFYGLLARLFYSPPDAAFLKALAMADELDATARRRPGCACESCFVTWCGFLRAGTTTPVPSSIT